MFSRIKLYLSEMYPLASRSLVSLLIFFEIYFVLLLNYRVTSFRIGIQEAVGTFTVFTFLLLLRIADDFKDYESDLLLFPERPLPSGRVTRRDLWILLAVLISLTVLGNLIFMNNLPWFIFLFTYGLLMSLWFFAKAKIRGSLLLAVITHNPVMMILNLYIISFTVIKYQLPAVTLTSVLIAFSLYFPGLIWEVARKIRAPQDETDYVTYSSIFGWRKATRFVQLLTLIDIITNFYLIYAINRPLMAVLAINVLIMTRLFSQYIKDPTRFHLIDKVERYTLITESVMVISVVIYLTIGYV